MPGDDSDGDIERPGFLEAVFDFVRPSSDSSDDSSDDDDDNPIGVIRSTGGGGSSSDGPVVTFDSDSTVTFDPSAVHTGSSGFSRISEDDVRRSQMAGGHSRVTNTSHNHIQTGSRLIVMNVNINQWIVIRAAESTGVTTSRFRALFTEGGVEGLAEHILSDAQGEIEDRIDYGDGPTHAFNQATNEWPTEVKAMLAAREAQEARGSSNYHNETEELARRFGHLDGRDELETKTDGNPFDEYSSHSAAVIHILVREGDCEVPDGFPREGHSQNDFIDWLRQTDSTEEAIEYSEYNPTIGTKVAEKLAPVAEWPSDLDPHNINRRSCSVCGGDFMEVYMEDEGRTWINSSGNISGGVNIREDERFIEVDRPDRSLLCGTCTDEWEGLSVRTVARTEDESFGVERSHGIAKDIGYDNDDYTPIESAPRGQDYELRAIAQGSTPDAWFEPQTSDFVDSPGSNTYDVIEDIADPNEVDINDGTVIVKVTSGESILYLPRDNPQVAKEVKTYIRDNVNSDDDNNDESNEIRFELTTNV